MNERDKLLRIAIFDEIDTERKRQDEPFGHEFDDKNTPCNWATLIAGQACAAAGSKTENLYRERVLKTAAIAVAALEAYDRIQGIVT